VTLDLSKAYIKAVTGASPQSKIIFDRFHVQRLAHEALDETRRDEVRKAATKDEKAALKGTRWALQKREWNLNDADVQTLEELERVNQPIFRAHLLKSLSLLSPSARDACELFLFDPRAPLPKKRVRQAWRDAIRKLCRDRAEREAAERGELYRELDQYVASTKQKGSTKFQELLQGLRDGIVVTGYRKELLETRPPSGRLASSV